MLSSNNVNMKPKLTSELAEFIGILAGDGHVTFNTRQNKILITGNLKTDLNYLKSYVKNLIETLFNIEPYFTYRKDRNAFVVYFYSKEIVDFIKQLGFYKLKSDIKIPPSIYQDCLKMQRFVRGLFDTDGSIFVSDKKGAPDYPCIELTTISKHLGILTANFLRNQGFRVPKIRSYKYKHSNNISYKVSLYGWENLSKWIAEIGFSNRYKLKRALEYQK